jgi:hypothetical protein
MAKEITEDEVREDVMVFANVLFERGMTDDPLGVVDESGNGGRSLWFHSVLRAEAFTGRPETSTTNSHRGLRQSAGHELN